MKVALVGRTRELLNTGNELLNRGHSIVVIATARSESYYKTEVQEFEDYARSLNAHYLYGSSLNSSDSIKIIQSSGAQIAVSVNWPVVLGESICSAFHHGIINAHAGDLPRYRGNACPNWAIINNESVVGLCLHKMEPNSLDTGPILMKEYFKLTSNTYISDVYEWMAKKIPLMFGDLVDKIENGGTDAHVQSSNALDWLRCYPRRPEDSRIDWHHHADYVHRLIRASSHPFLGAFTTLEGQHKMIIWRAELYQHPGNYLAVPGQILEKIGDKLVVACGSGTLMLTDFCFEPNAIPSPSISLRSRLL